MTRSNHFFRTLHQQKTTLAGGFNYTAKSPECEKSVVSALTSEQLFT
ncbi:MAG: hypothetical protein Q4G23_10170 [Clostridia bacterium]|nr:hypothetical protein [Clostridia bacterium]